MNFEQFCERLEHLRVDRAGGMAKPYKPLLVAAVIVLIHKKKITSPAIFLDGGLTSVFMQLLREIFPKWPFAANVRYPFRHLATDGIWRLVPRAGASGELIAALHNHVEAWQILRHVQCASLDEEVFHRLVRHYEARVRALQILWERWFPPDAAFKLMRLLRQPDDDVVANRIRSTEEFITEKALEEHLQEHWSQTAFGDMGIELSDPLRDGFACRQVLTPVNAIDLLGVRRRKREWWVFELKRGRPGDAVVGQASRYLSWIAEERRRDSVRGAIIARHADRKLIYAVRANPRLSLWEFDDSLNVREIV